MRPMIFALSKNGHCSRSFARALRPSKLVALRCPDARFTAEGRLCGHFPAPTGACRTTCRTDAGSDEPDLDRARPRLRNDDDWIICDHQLAKIMIGFRSCWKVRSCYDQDCSLGSGDVSLRLAPPPMFRRATSTGSIH